MRRILLVSFLMFVIAFISWGTFAEDITITTYYPAPFGVYRDLTTETLTVLNSNEQVTIGDDANNPSIELRDMDAGGLTPYIDFSNDADVDFDGRIILTGDNTLSIQGINRMDTCVLVNYPAPGVCPPCYFVSSFMAAPAGQMMCCRVSNPVGGGCP